MAWAASPRRATRPIAYVDIGVTNSLMSWCSTASGRVASSSAGIGSCHPANRRRISASGSGCRTPAGELRTACHSTRPSSNAMWPTGRADRGVRRAVAHEEGAAAVPRALCVRRRECSPSRAAGHPRPARGRGTRRRTRLPGRARRGGRRGPHPHPAGVHRRAGLRPAAVRRPGLPAGDPWARRDGSAVAPVRRGIAGMCPRSVSRGLFREAVRSGSDIEKAWIPAVPSLRVTAGPQDGAPGASPRHEQVA